MLLANAQKQSVQILSDAQNNGVAPFDFWGFIRQRGPLLSAYGTKASEREKWDVSKNQYNTLVRSAMSGVAKTMAAPAWEIQAPKTISKSRRLYYGDVMKAAGMGSAQTERPDVEYWQNILKQADFGKGFTAFRLTSIDYLRYDYGWWWEVIGPGSPSGPLTGPITGLAVLDSLRCYPTGDPDYPVLYLDRNNKLHKMFKDRVVQLLDMPETNEDYPGCGECALSRMIAIAQREVLMSRYVEANLDDAPAPGIIVAPGMNEQKKQEALVNYQREQAMDTNAPWGKQLWLFPLKADGDIKFETHSFQQAPDKFDFKTYTEIDVDHICAALNIDRQELWQLTGGNIGSGQQSEILHTKSRGKTIGLLRAEIIRHISDLLPEGYEFDFLYRDEQEEQNRAKTAQLWSTTISNDDDLDVNERRQLKANTIEEYHEVLTDDNGELIEHEEPQMVVPEPGDALPTPENTAQDQQSPARMQQKDFDPSAFETDFASLLRSIANEAVQRRRAGIVARALLRKYGREVFIQGLQDGGVTTRELDEDEQTVYALWLAQRSPYVTALLDRIYQDGVQINPENTAAMWATNSLQEMYYAGFQSASANKMMEFSGTDGLESCPTCQRLKGQRHRMKTWTARRLRPGVDSERFACKGFNCDHFLDPTEQPASGRLPDDVWVIATATARDKALLIAA